MPDAVALTASDPTIRTRGKRGPWAEIEGAQIAITAGNITTFTLTADATLSLTGKAVSLLLGVPVPIGTTPGSPAFTVTLTVSSATTAAGSLSAEQTATLTASGYRYAVTVAGQLVTHGRVRLTGDTPEVVRPPPAGP